MIHWAIYFLLLISDNFVAVVFVGFPPLIFFWFLGTELKHGTAHGHSILLTGLSFDGRIVIYEGHLNWNFAFVFNLESSMIWYSHTPWGTAGTMRNCRFVSQAVIEKFWCRARVILWMLSPDVGGAVVWLFSSISPHSTFIWCQGS